VVGVRVGVEGEHEMSAHLFDGGEVAIHLLEHRIDDEHLLGRFVHEQVGQGR